jgi:type II secretory pathway component PulF
LNPELPAVSLSLREKQTLYYSLAALVRSGVPFPTALDKLILTTHRGTRRFLESTRRLLGEGRTVGDALAAQSATVSPLEIAILSAVERSGHLDRGFSELSQYFGALHAARQSIIRQCIYPFFLLHLAIFALNLLTYFTRGPQYYWRAVGTALFFFYGAGIIVALAIPLLRDFGAGNASFDRLLNIFPLVGTIRRSFALSRFCTVFGLQLDAGVNVIDSVHNAGQSSRSGLVRSAVDSALPVIRGGSPVGPLLASSGAFPTDLAQAVIVGEETGSLDEELRRLSAEFRQKAMTALDILAEWLPKIIYFGTVIYIGWGIISFYLSYFAQLKAMTE